MSLGFKPLKKGEIEVCPISDVNEKTENAIVSEKSLAKNWNIYREDQIWKDL